MASAAIHCGPSKNWVTFRVTFVSRPTLLRNELPRMTARKPLTHVRQAEAAKPEEKPYKLNAGDGLFLEVTPKGAKRWRLRYFFAGKEKMLSLGLFPAVGLQDAKNARDDARRLLAQGSDPSEQRKSEKAASKIETANSFAVLAEEWMGRQTDKSESTRNKNQWLLKFAIDAFGRRPITEITAPMVLAACRAMESEGKLETANRIKSKCSQVFRYAVATGRLERDPTTDLRGALQTPQVKHRAALTDPKQVAELLRDIDTYRGQPPTVCALKLAPLIFIRPGELRAAKWADIDMDARQWSYTPPKTRNQTGTEHIVPLSSQAIAILRELHTLTGSSVYVFPQLTNMKKCMSENTVNGALRRMGYTSEEMCGHGFRAIARTILDEVLGYRIELIEQQLAHRVADMHGRAYNRTKHLAERSEMMQAWADYLDNLKKDSTAILLEKHG